MVRALARGKSFRTWCDGSSDRSLELFLVSASVTRLVYQRPWYVISCMWDGGYKITIAVNRKE